MLRAVCMKKLFQFVMMFLFCLFATCCITPTYIEQPKQDKQSLINDTNDSTIALIIDDQEDSHSIRAYCAGVWVNKNTILTAAHCVEDAGKPAPESEEDETIQLLKDLLSSTNWDPTNQPISYITKNDAFDTQGVNLNLDVTFPANGIITAFNKKVDLALIKSNTNHSHSIVTLANTIMSTGDSVFCIGHSLGLVWSYSEGRISQTRVMKGANHFDYKVFQVSIPTAVGNSGGGAFNEKGELVGIMSYYMPAGEDIAFFVHIDEIRKFLLEHDTELNR